jgi:hypothetical protein
MLRRPIAFPKEDRAMVREALRGYLALVGGLTEAAAAQVGALAEDLLVSSRRNREGLTLIARHETEQALRRLGLGAAGDVDALDQRVRRLEQAIRDLERTATPAKKTTAAAPTGARKSSATTRSATKRTTTKKTTAKKAATKQPSRRTAGSGS